MSKGPLQNPTASWPAVPSGPGRLSLFRTIETGRNQTEPPVNQRLGFEAVPNVFLVVNPRRIEWNEFKLRAMKIKSFDYPANAPVAVWSSIRLLLSKQLHCLIFCFYSTAEDGCLSHKTAVALGFLSTYLRLLLDILPDCFSSWCYFFHDRHFVKLVNVMESLRFAGLYCKPNFWCCTSLCVIKFVALFSIANRNILLTLNNFKLSGYRLLLVERLPIWRTAKIY